MNLQKDLKEFIELLNSANVKYLIVGGYAVAFHGHPRFTGDIDVFIECSEANARKMNVVLQDFGFKELGLSEQDFLKDGTIIQLGLPPNRIDIITAIDGVNFQDAWETKIPATLSGVPVHFISKDLLLKNKRAVGRTKDIADVEEIG